MNSGSSARARCEPICLRSNVMKVLLFGRRRRKVCRANSERTVHRSRSWDADWSPHRGRPKRPKHRRGTHGCCGDEHRDAHPEPACQLSPDAQRGDRLDPWRSPRTYHKIALPGIRHVRRRAGGAAACSLAASPDPNRAALVRVSCVARQGRDVADAASRPAPEREIMTWLIPHVRAAGDHSEALGLLEQPSPPQSHVKGRAKRDIRPLPPRRCRPKRRQDPRDRLLRGYPMDRAAAAVTRPNSMRPHQRNARHGAEHARDLLVEH